MTCSFYIRTLPAWILSIILLGGWQVFLVGCGSSDSVSEDAGPGGQDGQDGSDGGDPVSDLNPNEDDNDGDGILNEVEDKNGNGIVDEGETDPNNADSDGDGLNDGVEDGNKNGQVDWGETDPLDSDSDQDGILDGTEDKNHNGQVDPGESSPLMPDSDYDNIPDGVEDANQNGQVDPGETSPTEADSDGDGLDDGIEDKNQNGIVDPGEYDPNDPDMDNDGVLDGDEDHNGDGVIGKCTTPCNQGCSPEEVCSQTAGVCFSPACAEGETDPFSSDTDGDGTNDNEEASVLVCSAENLKQVDYHSSELADFRFVLELFFTVSSFLQNNGEDIGFAFYSPQYQMAGFLVSRTPSGIINDAAEQEAQDRVSISTMATGLSSATTRALTTFDGYDAVIADYDISVSSQTPTDLANNLVTKFLSGQQPTGQLAQQGDPAADYHLATETVYRDSSQVIVVGVLTAASYLEDDQIIRMNDVSNSTALAGYTDQTDVACESFASVGVNPVDFIWVVDNSGSMSSEQDAVSAAGQAMVDLLATTSLDWRIGVTNTDRDTDGVLASGFTRDVSVFQADIKQGTGGSSSEYSLGMGIRALERSSPCTIQENSTKLRCDAIPIIVVLTDEEDEDIENASGGEGYSGPPNSTTVNNFIQSYNSFGAILFAIAGGEPACPTAQDSSKGINAVVNGIGGGSVGSICTTDQTQNVENIIRAASGVSSTYVLSNPAISSTIKVAMVLEAGQLPQEVPRSRSDGFDYDSVSYTILFYGGFRPEYDDLDVVVSYRYFIDCQPKTEECDGLDNDCDGLTDEDFDGDSDGVAVCNGDCDDSDPEVSPNEPEICDDKDNDCDGSIDEGFDNDQDGFRTCDEDCDDDNDTVFPGAPERCDEIDNDCDGITDPPWACG
jgi:hypothetical protein